MAELKFFSALLVSAALLALSACMADAALVVVGEIHLNGRPVHGQCTIELRDPSNGDLVDFQEGVDVSPFRKDFGVAPYAQSYYISAVCPSGVGRSKPFSFDPPSETINLQVIDLVADRHGD